MQLATFLKSVTSGTKVIAHLGLKRKNHKNAEDIKTILASRLKELGIENFSINCYLKRRGKNSFSVNPDAINVFLNGPNFKISRNQ